MVKKLRKEEQEESSDSEISQDEEAEEDQEEQESQERAGQSDGKSEDGSDVDSDVEIAQREANEQADLEEKFGLKAINDEPGMLKRLKEIQLNFYSRIESKKLVKKQGKIPFTEHMTISKYSSFQSSNMLSPLMN